MSMRTKSGTDNASLAIGAFVFTFTAAMLAFMTVDAEARYSVIDALRFLLP